MDKFIPGMSVICGYKRVVIKEMHGCAVKSITDGSFISSGSHLLVFKPTDENIALADSVCEIYDSINRTEGTRGINWPMVHSYMEQKCAHAMSGVITHPEALASCEGLRDEILAAVSVKSKVGFSLFR